MTLMQLVFLTLACPLGIVYLYIGLMRNDYVFIAGGIALSLFPIFFSDPFTLGALYVTLSPAPYIVRKMVSKRTK